MIEIYSRTDEKKEYGVTRIIENKEKIDVTVVIRSQIYSHLTQKIIDLIKSEIDTVKSRVDQSNEK